MAGRAQPVGRERVADLAQLVLGRAARRRARRPRRRAPRGRSARPRPTPRRAGRGSRAAPRRGSRARASTCQRQVESAPPETSAVTSPPGGISSCSRMCSSTRARSSSLTATVLQRREASEQRRDVAAELGERLLVAQTGRCARSSPGRRRGTSARPASRCRWWSCTPCAYSFSIPITRRWVCRSEKSVGPVPRMIFAARARLADHVLGRGVAALVLLAPELERGHVRPRVVDELAVGGRAGVHQIWLRAPIRHERKRNRDDDEQASRSEAESPHVHSFGTRRPSEPPPFGAFSALREDDAAVGDRVAHADRSRRRGSPARSRGGRTGRRSATRSSSSRQRSRIPRWA